VLKLRSLWRRLLVSSWWFCEGVTCVIALLRGCGARGGPGRPAKAPAPAEVPRKAVGDIGGNAPGIAAATAAQDLLSGTATNENWMRNIRDKSLDSPVLQKSGGVVVEFG
jgi:hypothetical protein